MSRRRPAETGTDGTCLLGRARTSRRKEDVVSVQRPGPPALLDLHALRGTVTRHFLDVIAGPGLSFSFVQLIERLPPARPPVQVKLGNPISHRATSPRALVEAASLVDLGDQRLRHGVEPSHAAWVTATRRLLPDPSFWPLYLAVWRWARSRRMPTRRRLHRWDRGTHLRGGAFPCWLSLSPSSEKRRSIWRIPRPFPRRNAAFASRLSPRAGPDDEG